LSDPKRNLLVGLLALKNGLVTERELVGALEAWRADRSRSLLDHLAAQDQVTDLVRTQLEALAAAHVRDHNGDLEQSLAAVPTSVLAIETLAALEDSDLGATIDHVEEDPTTRHDETSPGAIGALADPGARDGSRFRALRLHAYGALGAVYLAIDSELNREVALKQIRDHHADDPASRQRFIQEAEITGGLEHPGVVPVYGLGTHKDGRPYYAMRFIRGETLKAGIDRFHNDSTLKQDPGRRSLELRTLLRRFTDVCNAIEYAHSRGVVHRDIKPSNIIVGKHGETLVVDWGLAKALGGRESAGATGEHALVPSVLGSTETMPGSVQGTPAYMSPEQAHGDLDRVGPRSDIYSLGATLYHLLSGRPPFVGSNVSEVLKDVQRGNFERPRHHEPSIDKALDTVCLKAMAVRPEDRYDSCRALSEDLDRWMADEPVTAWREPFSRRAVRWGRRHRTAVTAAVVALLAGVFGLSAVLAIQTRTNFELESANNRVRDSVDRMLTEVGAVELADVPMMEPVRARLLRAALGFYEDFLDRKRGSRRWLRDAVKVQLNLAQVQDLLGAGVDAEQSYRKVIDRLRPSSLAEERPDLATAWDGLGMVLKKFDRFREAEGALREGLLIREGLAAEQPADPIRRGALAESRYHLGTVLARVSKRGPDDERIYREAIEEQKRLLAETRQHPEQQGKLARFLNNLGILLRDGGRIDDAQAALDEAKLLLDELITSSPNNPGHRWQRARTLNNLGSLWQARGSPDRTESLLDKARKELLPLVADYPSVPEYRRDLASVWYNLGLVRAAQKRTEDATRAYQAAIELQRQLTMDFPLMPGDRNRLAMTRNSLAMLRSQTDPITAEPVCREAVAEQRKLVENSPNVSEYRQALGRALWGLSLCLIGQQKYEEAARHLDEAIALHRSTLASPPDQVGLTLLHDDYFVLAKTLADMGDHSRASAAAEQLPVLLPESRKSYLATAAFLVRCADLARRDQTKEESTRNQAADAYALRAVQWLDKAIERGLIAEPSVLDHGELSPLRGRPDFEALRARLRGQLAPRYG
jgi:serine/threonine-protein kinase